MAPTPGTMAFADRIIFMANVLTGIGAPRSFGNILTLLGWAAKENTKAKNNPLATTAGWIKNPDGSDPGFFNTISGEGEPKRGVRNYDNPLTGVEATVATFLQKKEDGEFKYYGPIVELLRKGTTDKEVLADPEAVKAIRTWGSFAPKKDPKTGKVIRDENGEIVYSDNWGSRPQWGATEEELKSLGYTKTGQTDDAFIEDFTEWAKTEPSLPEVVTDSPVTFAENLLEGALAPRLDEDGLPLGVFDLDPQDARGEPLLPDSDEVSRPLNPFGAIPSEHDPDEAQRLAEGIASGELVGAEAQVDALEGGIPESWKNRELVDQSQPAPRRDARGIGITGAESIFYEDILAETTEALYAKAAETLGIPATTSSRGSSLQKKVWDAWDTFDERQERYLNAEDLAEQTLQLFEEKASRHRGGRAVVDDEDRKLLFALIGTGRTGSQGSAITGLSIASPELTALYHNKNATYAEVLTELRNAPAFAKSLAQQLDSQEGRIHEIMDMLDTLSSKGMDTGAAEEYRTKEGEEEGVAHAEWMVQTGIGIIKDSAELLGTDEFVNQLDQLAEPGTFDRQAPRDSNEFLHALAVDEHLSPLDVGPMGPPNAPFYGGTGDKLTLSDGTSAGVAPVPVVADEEYEARIGEAIKPRYDEEGLPLGVFSTDPEEIYNFTKGDTKGISDEALEYIAEEFGGSQAFYYSLGKKLWVDVEGDNLPPMHLLKYLEETGESNEDEIWKLFASTEWFGEIDATGRDFQEKWHLIGGKDGWVPILGDDNMTWNMTPDMLAELDPQYDILIREAERLGIPTDDPRKKEALMQMAYNAKLLNLDGYEIRKEFLENVDLSFNRQAVTESSTFGAIRANLKQRSGKYMLRLSEQAIDDFAQDIYLGEITYDALDAGFAEQAKTNNPAIASLIDQGYTPSAYFSSYAGIASQLLERPVDFMSGRDSKMFGVLTGQGQIDDGNQRILSRNEFERYVRSQPEWERTDNGRDAAYGAVTNLLGSFGFPGYG